MIKRIAAVVAVVALTVGLSACEDESNSAQQSGQKLTEQAFGQQQTAVPYPADELQDSLERRNLKERLLRQNDPDKIGYVYFFPFGAGEPLGYWTIKGKVSSTQSQMTTDVLQVDTPDDGSNAKDTVVTAPGDDGSYGQNEKGVFFFTTEGAMVQVCEECYFYSDQPVNLGVVIPELNAKK